MDAGRVEGAPRLGEFGMNFWKEWSLMGELIGVWVRVCAILKKYDIDIFGDFFDNDN